MYYVPLLFYQLNVMEPSGHGFCEGVIAQAYSQVKSEKGADVNDVQQIVMILRGDEYPKELYEYIVQWETISHCENLQINIGRQCWVRCVQ